MLQGGTILSIAEFRQKGFGDAMRKVCQRMLPGRKLEVLPEKHRLYSKKVCYDIPAEHLKFEMIGSDSHPLIIHTDADLAARWQAGVFHGRSAPYFKAAVNIVKHKAPKLLNLPKPAK